MLILVDGGHAISQPEGETLTGNSRLSWSVAEEENIFLGS